MSNGWAKLLLGTSTKANKAHNFLKLVKILHILVEEVWNRKLQRSCNTHAYKLLLGFRGKGIAVDTWLIGSLLYLIASRPNIMFSVCMCARYQSNPKESHYNDVKRILKYLKGTINIRMLYPSDASLNLAGFSNFFFVGFNLYWKKYKWYVSSSWILSVKL